MPITSGSHQMFGELLLDRDASELLEEWLEAPNYDDEFERRDRRWWLEATFVPDGKRLCIYEEERSNYRTVERRVDQAGRLAAEALEGWVIVQHFENGAHIHSWRVEDGTVETSEEHADEGYAVPEGLEEVVDHYHREVSRQDEEFESRAPEERFEEVAVRHVPQIPYVVVHGGDERMRRAALDRLSEVVPEPRVPWDERANADGEGTLVVPELEVLSEDELQELADFVDDTEMRVLAGTPEQEPLAVLPGRLVFPFSQGTIDLSEVYPSPKDEPIE